MQVDESGADEPDPARPPTSHSKSPHAMFRFTSMLVNESSTDDADQTRPCTATSKPSQALPKRNAVRNPGQPSLVMTPNLNAIKRIKKHHGIPRRSHLVGIKVSVSSVSWCSSLTKYVYVNRMINRPRHMSLLLNHRPSPCHERILPHRFQKSWMPSQRVSRLPYSVCLAWTPRLASSPHTWSEAPGEKGLQTKNWS